MEINNLIQKLRKINRGVSFNIWRVRIGGLEMALFFLFAIGEKFISKFAPMEPATKEIVSETLSCISVLILGEAILRSLYKLFPRYRWATLAAMIGGAIGGLVITIIMNYADGTTENMKTDLIALGVCTLLFVAAFMLWRQSVRRVAEIKLERATQRKRHKQTY
jgi:nitrate/nitrite transporter NarK